MVHEAKLARSCHFRDGEDLRNKSSRNQYLAKADILIFACSQKRNFRAKNIRNDNVEKMCLKINKLIILTNYTLMTIKTVLE